MLYIFREVCFSEGMMMFEGSGKILDWVMEAAIQEFIKLSAWINLLNSLSHDSTIIPPGPEPLLTDRKNEKSFQRNPAAGLVS